MLLVLVGPSRAGKSTLGRKIAEQFSEIQFFDLDQLVESRRDRELRAGVADAGWTQFWERSRLELDVLQQLSLNRTVLVAVGAGSLQTQMGRDYVACSKSVITVTASFETILSRHPGRSVDELHSTEFSPERQAVYAIGQPVGTSVPEAESLDTLIRIVQRLIQQREVQS
jgi:shikimate kinase